MPKMILALRALARLYFDISIWRRGPQDVPAVTILLPLTALAYACLSLAIGEVVPSLRPGWVLQVIGDTAFLALWYWLLLLIMHRRDRYLQTASALFGMQTTVAAPSVCALWMTNQFLAQNHIAQAPPGLVALSVLLWVAVAVWTLLATSHIVRAAIERPLGLCLILTLAQMFAEGLLLESLNPEH
jgi:hypothetical protein